MTGNRVNPFQTEGLFLYPPENRKSGFLMFSGGIERNQWHKMSEEEKRCMARITQNKLQTIFSLCSLVRSSHSVLFVKIGVLKNFAIFTEKHQCWSLLGLQLY